MKLQSLEKQCKNYPKIHDQTKVAVAPSLPEYATEVIAAQRSWWLSRLNAFRRRPPMLR